MIFETCDRVEEVPTAPQPETFHDVLPVQIPGLQSALSGVILPAVRPWDQGAEPSAENKDVPDPETGCGRRPKRSAQSRRLPGRFREILPEGPAPMVPVAQPSVVPPVSNTPPSPHIPGTNTADSDGDMEMEDQDFGSVQEPTKVYQTLRNAFNVFREYKSLPLRIPDEGAPLESFAVENVALDTENLAEKLKEAIKPFDNMSTYRLGHWYHNCGGVLSRSNLAALIADVLKAEDFRKDDLPGTSTIDKLNAALDELDIGKMESEEPGERVGGDGWVEESVRIEIPTGVKQAEP
ncbi:hypothetical protein M407DRAFT_24651 [Tulasnella calospora MUT 4182]|uniref:Uncharacterized protein n=1 Tax=Tulasnella calospora MUT 4182 TaxID=1051891 RepID=A0A0C3QJ31_9AGAM|nr:hypothetical protein M407DRAFT_24651 [Tulasnella calospora MUT 4182]